MTVEELRKRRELRNGVRRLNTKGSFSRAARAGETFSSVANCRVDMPDNILAIGVPEELLEWMAGFFDAEGSISLQMQLRSNRPSPKFTLAISLANTNLDGLSPYVRAYGGRTYLNRENRIGLDGLKWSDSFRW